MSLFGQVRMYGRFAWGLRGFLKEPITLEQSHAIIRQRLADREQNLLAIVKRAIYGNENSPYLRLLKLAGHGIQVVSVIGNGGSRGQVEHGQLARYERELGVKLGQTARYERQA